MGASMVVRLAEGLELLDQAAKRPYIGAVGGDQERVERLDEVVIDPIATDPLTA